MKINKLFKVLVIGFLIATASPAMSNSPTATPVKNESERAQQLIQRLEEIKAKDTDKLTRSEKKQLRKEVHAIKKELATISGGVYLSIGAIIIIILLLILLL
jgi:predicted PurR-regulated permease PerM